MRRRTLLAALGLLLLLPSSFPPRTDAPILPDPLPAAQPLTVLRGTIVRNATLESVLGEALGPQGLYHLVQTARPLYDLARLTVG